MRRDRVKTLQINPSQIDLKTRASVSSALRRNRRDQSLGQTDDLQCRACAERAMIETSDAGRLDPLRAAFSFSKALRRGYDKSFAVQRSI
jgi:hypothetical protein